MRVGIATYESPDVADLDVGRVVPALERAGHAGEVVPWTDESTDWGGFDVVWLSSTWDYHEHLERFRAWLRDVDAVTDVHNPPRIVEWNLDKRYLRELEAHGVSIIPTVWGEPAEARRAADEVAASGWDRIVVKPAIDLGARNLRVVEPDGVEEAVAAIGAASLVQPYLASVESDGETSIVYFRGEYAHAVHKQPAAGDFRVQQQYGGRYTVVDPDEDSLALGEDALSALRAATGVAGDLLYARVDIVRDPHGEPRVIELELIEPSLYLDVVGDEAADRFAALLTA
jgi:hypothetical protein